jgi:HSP20 family protein
LPASVARASAAAGKNAGDLEVFITPRRGAREAGRASPQRAAPSRRRSEVRHVQGVLRHDRVTWAGQSRTETLKEANAMNLIPWRRQGNGFGALRRQINRVFEDFGLSDLEFTGLPEAAGEWGPALDVAETPESFVVKAELPGIDPKQVEISVIGNTLTIKGEKQAEKEEKGKTWHRVERSYGAFTRTFTPPVAVRADKIEAEAKDGVFTITLPKSTEALPKKIAVKAKATS